MAWDRGGLSARYGDPSKPSRSFADKLRVLTRTESSGKLLRTPPGGRKPGPSHLTPNRRRLSKEELQSTHADSRKHIECCVFFSSTNFSELRRPRVYVTSTCYVTIILFVVPVLG